ncbi:hypothetical protein ILUMI_06218, partial [Ignelater luminosus]
AMPSLSNTGGISNISPCPDAFPIIPDLDLLLVDPKNPEMREIVLDEFLENPSIVVANNNSEIIDEDEDFDDSIKDKDYHYKPEEVELVRKQMNLDLKIAAVTENVKTLTFDMQKTLPLQRLSTNIIFYKRQLWLYNCGLHTGKDNKSIFNIWLEGHAGRGAQKVGSCIRKYVVNHISDKIQELILWSDSCEGQNRNIKGIPLSSSSNIFVQHLKILWPGRKPIAQAKAGELRSISHLIPVADHLLYTNIVGDANNEEDIDDYNGELDFQIETHSEENDNIQSL